MTNSPDSSRYEAPARILHWLVAGGIVLQYLLGERAEEAGAAEELASQLATLAQHKSIGITLLALVILRILWRFARPAPPLPASYSTPHPTLARLANWMHIALYALLLFLPVSGWLMSSASAYSVSWFGWVQLPDLIAPNASSKEWLQTAHHLAARGLLVLALLHIAAAFKHLWLDKDKLMLRMTDPVSLSLFTLTVLAGTWLTWPASLTAAAEPASARPTGAAVAPAEPVQPPSTTSQPGAWEVDYPRSKIGFTANQAGAEFRGYWGEFSADIRFDAARLATSRAVVSIAATSVSTKDEERDSTLAGSDWFNSAQFDTVVFTASEFTPTATGFSTVASLEIRGKAYPVTFDFSLKHSGSDVELTGTALLDRLALGLGTREWADTEWVGQFVTVDVVVVGTR